ncbi:diguanylate cyclase [Lysobacter koreensis]|uniref:diguanylate cyclase n=1 Tax=Lysobacter koreensis TaxID=266122 RepID=A0ABW2YLX5_9GAMM
MRWLVLVACLAGSSMAHAADAPGTYSFRSYGPDQGLRNQAVTSLAQDRAGFLYVGTEDGLFRYDGEHFQRLGVANGLPSDSVTVLHATRQGRLWVATGKGMVAWAGTLPDPQVGGVLLPDQEVLGIASSDSGRLLVSTSAGSFEGDAPQLKPVPGLPRQAGAGWLAPDGREALLAVRGVLHRRDAAGRWHARRLPAAVAGETAQALLKDSRGRIWIRGRQMLLRLDRFDAPVQDLSARLPGAAVQKGELHHDAAGRVWAPTNHGIAFFDGAEQGLIDDVRGLPNEWATTVLMDREGSLWVGSEGVHRLQGRLAWTSFSRRQELPSDTVWAVMRDRAGTLWAATNRGVAHASARGWVALPATQARSFYAFAEGPAGDLWIGGNSGQAGTNTLLRRAPGAADFRPVPLTSARGPSTVNSLAFGADGALYVATMAHGLHRLTPAGTGFASQAVVLPGGAVDEQINQLARDPGGRLWAAGMRGLAVHDGRQWRRLGTADGLLESQVETITPAGAHGLWVSYWNVDGLSRVRVLAGGPRVVEHVTRPDALVGDTVYSAGLDRHGIVWLGTAMGVKRWRHGRIERFGRADGLPGDDASANAFWADANGDLWFGMANGLAHFDARHDAGVPKPPVTLVTSVQDGQARHLAAAIAQVAWDDRALTFRFAALSFLDETRIQRQVRLLGFENAWRDTRVSEARYTGLLPGRYRFQVRARYGAGAFGPIATRTVAVLPPWWLTWWFLALTVAAVVLLAVLALRWWLRRLRRKNLQLEALVAARTRELQVANAALEEASMVDPLTGLKNRRYLAVFMPEELARCLRQRRVDADEARDARGRNLDLCLLMVDLDHFKSVNDTHGHAAGDLVLRQVAQVMRAACRESDVVVRWGGEEFLILARNADRDQAQVLAAMVCDAVRAHPFDLGNGVVLRKTCSLGFSAFPLVPGQPERFGWEAAVELADQCLYAAKNSGRDGWVGCLVQDPVAAADGALPAMQELAGDGQGRILSSFPESSVPAGTNGIAATRGEAPRWQPGIGREAAALQPGPVCTE